MLQIKRIYEAASNDDGYRILVDRLWARGVSKEEAELDNWFKDIAPSNETRKAFDHEEDKFENFEKKYLNELNKNKETKQFLDLIRDKLKLGNVTLLYAAKDQEMNNAVVLKKWLEEHL